MWVLFTLHKLSWPRASNKNKSRIVIDNAQTAVKRGACAQFLLKLLLNEVFAMAPHCPHSRQTQKSNATSGVRRLEFCKNLKRKPARLLKKTVIEVVLWVKITSWESLRMSISKFPGHMRSTKLNVSATVLTLDPKAKSFENLRLC